MDFIEISGNIIFTEKLERMLIEKKESGDAKWYSFTFYYISGNSFVTDWYEKEYSANILSKVLGIEITSARVIINNLKTSVYDTTVPMPLHREETKIEPEIKPDDEIDKDKE